MFSNTDTNIFNPKLVPTQCIAVNYEYGKKNKTKLYNNERGGNEVTRAPTSPSAGGLHGSGIFCHPLW